MAKVFPGRRFGSCAAPLNPDTFDGLHKLGESDDAAKAIVTAIMEKAGISPDDAARSLAAANAKPASALPLFLPGAVHALPRYGSNVSIGKEQKLTFDLETGIDPPEKKGMKWTFKVLVNGDEPLALLDVRDNIGAGFQFQFEEKSFGAIGSASRRVLAEMKDKWIEVIAAWTPFANEKVANFFCKIDGKGAFGDSPRAHWTSVRRPGMEIWAKEGGIVVSEGWIEIIDALPN